MTMSLATLDGWPCLPLQGIPARERAEVDSFLARRIRLAEQHHPSGRVGLTPIRIPKETSTRARILVTLRKAPRPLEAQEIAKTIHGGSPKGFRNGPGYATQIYRVLKQLVREGTVLALMRTWIDAEGGTWKYPVFWVE